MIVHKKGVHYSLVTTDNKEVELIFCHKDKDKKFINGITDEELVRVLVDRYEHHLYRDESHTNINVMTLLKQILGFMFKRIRNKDSTEKSSV